MCDLTQLGHMPFLDEQAHEVPDELVRAGENLLDHAFLHPGVGLLVREQPGELRNRVEGFDEVRELRVDDVEPALLGSSLVERRCVDAVPGSYEWLASNCEKSISASASSIRRC